MPLDGGTAHVDVVPNFGNFASTLNSVVGRASGTAARNAEGIFANMEKRIGANLSRTGGGFQQLGSKGLASMKSLQGGALLAAGATGLLGAGIAALAADGVKKYVALGAEVRKFQRVTGESAETSSKMVLVMQRFGIDADKGAMAMARFGRNAADTPEKFAKLGIEIERTNKGTIDVYGTLLNAADAFQKVGPGAEGTTLAMELFGRTGANLIPVLSKSREELEQLEKVFKRRGLILSEEDLKRTKEFSLAQKDLASATTGLQISLGKAIVPVLTQAAAATTIATDAANDLNLSYGGLSLPAALKEAPKFIQGLAAGILTLGAQSGTTAEQMEEMVQVYSARGPIQARVLQLNKDLIEDEEKLGAAAAQLEAQYQGWGEAMGFTAEQMLAFVQGSPDMEQAAARISAEVAKAMEATKQSFESAFDVVGKLGGGQVFAEFEADAVRVRDIFGSIGDRLTPAGDKIATFYATALLQARQFTTGIQSAIAQGYDPAFVSRLLQAGPEQAAPILQAITEGHGTKLREIVNAAEAEISKTSAAVVETARLTHIAVTAPNSQIAAMLQDAMRINQRIMQMGGSQSIEAFAAGLQMPIGRVQEIMHHYGITMPEQQLGPLPAEAQRIGDQSGQNLAGGLAGQAPAAGAAAGQVTTAAQQGLGPMPPYGQFIGATTGANVIQFLGGHIAGVFAKAMEVTGAAQQGMSPMPGHGYYAGSVTGDKVVGGLGEHVGRILAKAGEYSVNLARGIDPILAAIGAPQIAAAAAAAVGNFFKAAKGGVLARESEFRGPGQWVEWAERPTGGETHLFLPEHGASEKTKQLYEAVGPKLGYDAVKRDKFAVGGIVGASMFGGPTDPGTGHIGYRGDNLRGTMAFAELAMGTALGGLAYRTTLPIGFRGKTVTGIKLDIGRGGGPVQGHPRKIDLWYELANALGFGTGVGLVEIGGPGTALPGGGGLPAVNLPKPPGYEGHGTVLGPTAQKTSQFAYDKATAWANEQMAKHAPAGGIGVGGVIGPATGSVGGNWQSIVAYLRGKGVNPTVTSTFRPGDPGFHGRGKAVDMVGNMRQIFDTLGPGGGNPVPGINELFYDPAGFYYDEGKRRSGAIGGHSDHVHAAVFRLGGLLKNVQAQLLDGGGFLPPKSATLAINDTNRPEMFGFPEDFVPKGDDGGRMDEMAGELKSLVSELRETRVAVIKIGEREFGRATFKAQHSVARSRA